MSEATMDAARLPETMQALLFYGRGDVRLERLCVPTPGPEEVLLCVQSVGLCGTDAGEFAHGPLVFPVDHPHPVTGHVGPLVMGHEFAGRVVEIGQGVDSSWLGRPVASCGAISCGRCRACQLGRTNLCANYSAVGMHRPGALAGYVATPVANCVAVDELGLPPDAAALGQPMSIAVHACRRGRPVSGERALVIGAGGIGAFIVFVLATWGLSVRVLDPDLPRRKLALRLGAAEVVDPGEPAASQSNGYDVVWETSGTPAGMALALAAVGRGARLVLVGLQSDVVPVDLRAITQNEVELIGSNAMVMDTDFEQALQLVASRREGWSDVAPTVLPLSEVVEGALIDMSQGRSRVVKALVDPWAARRRASETRPIRFASSDGT